MAERFQSFSAVLPMIYKDGKVLLQLRQNTGYKDGYWDFAGSGHVEKGETATQALIRECREELGISISEDEPTLKHISQVVFPERTYLYFYFSVHHFDRIPTIQENEKCAQLAWFSIEQLPENMIPIHQANLERILTGKFYSEIKL